MKEKGYIQVYTGNGKGKTTSAMGLMVRALGAGYKVFFAQFMKGMDYSELKFIETLENVELERFGSDQFIFGKPSDDDKIRAERGLDLCRQKMLSGEFDVVILDEINVCVSVGILDEEEVLRFIDKKPEHVELVLTGRGATQAIIDRADLVTEMREIKHYYKKGVQARVGIEK